MVWGLLRFGGLRRRGLGMFRGWVAVGDVRAGGMGESWMMYVPQV